MAELFCKTKTLILHVIFIVIKRRVEGVWALGFAQQGGGFGLGLAEKGRGMGGGLGLF